MPVQTTSADATTHAHPDVDGEKLFAKIAWRLIPYIFVLYILAYLDRVNVGFAALEIKRSLTLVKSHCLKVCHSRAARARSNTLKWREQRLSVVVLSRH